jgi:putative addiction module component (TIGR02574 family)
LEQDVVIQEGPTMNVAATVKDITALSVEERIRIVQAILESIAVDQDDFDLTDEQIQELERRSRDYDANPGDVMSHEEVMASIRRRQ